MTHCLMLCLVLALPVGTWCYLLAGQLWQRTGCHDAWPGFGTYPGIVTVVFSAGSEIAPAGCTGEGDVQGRKVIAPEVGRQYHHSV